MTKPFNHQPLDASRIADLANAGTAHGRSWRVEVAEEVRSTNDAVREGLVLREGSEGRALFAESQTHGRGRRGARWLSGEPGESLLFSCAVRPPFPVDHWPRLTHIAALAVAKALDEHAALSARVKWPNDIYLQEKKTAGILVETFFSPAGAPVAIIGVGINVNQEAEAFPETLSAPATSMRAEAGRVFDRSELAGQVLRSLADILESSSSGFAAVVEALEERALWLGEAVRVLAGEKIFTGIHRGLGPEGELRLTLETGQTLELAGAAELRRAGG